MHTVFKCAGTLRPVEDAGGEWVRKDRVWRVNAHLKYRLKASPEQPLVVDIYGYNIMGFGRAIYRLDLDNGVSLTGRTYGVGPLDSPELQKVHMVDVREPLIGLFPDLASQPPPEVDTFVFGIVSSRPLAYMSCRTRGWSIPGRPFHFIEGALPDDERKKGLGWTTHLLRISHRGYEICFGPTSKYWKELVDLRTLFHDTIVGVRKRDREVITWNEFNQLKDVLENFIGWVNHCVSPVYHVKAYREGRLAYRGYSLHPHPTRARDRFSWLPTFSQDHAERFDGMVEQALEAFAVRWETSRENDDFFHLALRMLRSEERGVPGSRPSTLYLRDAFGAMAILTSMLVGSEPSRGRHDTVVQCLKKLNLADRIPGARGRKRLSQEFSELWRTREGDVKEEERKRGTLARPLSNVENWLLHLEDFENAKRLLGLGDQGQAYFVQVSIWLADLMLMRVVGYSGDYHNRLTGQTEPVPWER